MDKRPPNVMALFDEALEITSPPERQAYLDAACADWPELRQQVNALLEAYEKAGSFLEPPPPAEALTIDAPLTVDAPMVEGPGTIIGPYRLLEQIGQGGFGAVFMAEQKEPIRRKVALKVVKPGMDSKEVIARFEAERQALALMDHPNIAKVLDAGQTATGRPYFVMDLVKGMTITKFCDQGQLTLKERLQLFIDVCKAVQHAHHKGIIHRDIKPSNVLVTLQDGAPLVKVIDFGIAKALGQQLTDKTLFTGFAQMIGTPLYMSPEQAALSNVDVDTRCDIYSLGVLLYELLTGTTPFDRKRFRQAAFDEIRRIIREEEPPKPSTRISTLGEAAVPASAQRKSSPKRLSQLFRGELDWIVMKALDKDRNRRFETANGFAEDVLRYLADEPVLAGPPTASYRLRKFARRHRAALFVALAVALVLAVAVGGIGWVLGDRAARTAEITRQVQGSIAIIRTLVAANRLPEAHQKLAEAKAQLASDKEALGDVAVQVERFEYELERFQEFLDLIERAYQGEASPRLESRLLAQPARDGGVAPVTPAPRERYTAAAVPRLLGALQNYAILERDDWKAAAQRSLLTDKHVEQIARLAYEGLLWLADDVLRRQVDHRSMDNLSGAGAAQKALVYLGKAQNAYPPTQALFALRARCREALGEQAAAAADRQLAARTAPKIAADHYLRGLTASNEGRKAEAIQAFEAALVLEPTHYWSMMNLGYCLADGPSEQDLVGAARVFSGCILKRPEHEYGYYARAIMYLQLGRFQDAIADCSKAIGVEPNMAGAWMFRGAAYSKLGDKAKAIFNCAKAIQLNPKYPPAYLHRGRVYANLGNWERALADYSMALKLEPTFAAAWNDLCETYFRLEQWEKAVAVFSQRLAWDPKFGPALVNRGLAYARLGKQEEALADLARATDLYPHWDGAWMNRVNVCAQLRPWEKALGEYSKTLDTWSKAIALTPQDHERHNNQAWLLATHAEARFRDPRRAVELAESCVKLAPTAATNWNTLGAARYRAGAWPEALQAFEKSMRLSGGGNSFDWFFLAMTHCRLGDREQARKEYDRAVQWADLHHPRNDELRRFRAEAAEMLAMSE